MMRRSAGFDADKARRQLLKEWYDVPALELTANDYITCRVNSVDLKNRLRDIETDCRDRLHVWLLRIVGVSTAPTSMALPCRWRSRPQHQKRTFCIAADFLFDDLYREQQAIGRVSTALSSRFLTPLFTMWAVAFAKHPLRKAAWSSGSSCRRLTCEDPT